MSQHSDRIAPHGGILVNRIATLDQRQEFFDQAESLPRVQLSDRSISDLQMIAIGALSPLKGFMNEADYLSVVKQMRLWNGLPWSVPITLSVTEAVADTLKEGTLVRLDTPAGEFAGILELAEKYRYSKEQEALNVYRTDDLKHPGVQVVDKSGPVNLADGIEAMFKDCKTGGYNLEGCQASPDKLTSLIILIALAMTSASLKRKRTQLQRQEKYICRPQEKGRNRRRHSKFWIGLYGENWLIANDCCWE